jgi:hypothetical protein
VRGCRRAPAAEPRQEPRSSESPNLGRKSGGSGPASSSSGPGRAAGTDQAARPSPWKFERSSDGCPRRTPSGARRGFTGSFRSWASRFPRQQCPSTSSAIGSRHRRPGEPFSRTTLVSVDFFVVPTVLFKVLFVFVILVHERRRVVHINVTDAPTAQWTAQQLVEAFPWETVPRATSCATVMQSTGSCSQAEPRPWGSTKSRRRPGPLGRIRTWNTSSEPSAASASIIWSC